MINPQLVADAFKTTTRLPFPTPPTPTSSVAPIPTVVPDAPHFEKIGEAGARTLWVRQTFQAYT